MSVDLFDVEQLDSPELLESELASLYRRLVLEISILKDKFFSFREQGIVSGLSGGAIKEVVKIAESDSVMNHRQRVCLLDVCKALLDKRTELSEGVVEVFTPEHVREKAQNLRGRGVYFSFEALVRSSGVRKDSLEKLLRGFSFEEGPLDTSSAFIRQAIACSRTMKALGAVEADFISEIDEYRQELLVQFTDAFNEGGVGRSGRLCAEAPQYSFIPEMAFQCVETEPKITTFLGEDLLQEISDEVHCVLEGAWEETEHDSVWSFLSEKMYSQVIVNVDEYLRQLRRRLVRTQTAVVEAAIEMRDFARTLDN